MRSSEDLMKRRLPTGASSNGRIDFSSSAGRALSRMPSASQEVNRKGLMSFTWHLNLFKEWRTERPLMFTTSNHLLHGFNRNMSYPSSSDVTDYCASSFRTGPGSRDRIILMTLISSQSTNTLRRKGHRGGIPGKPFMANRAITIR